VEVHDVKDEVPAVLEAGALGRRTVRPGVAPILAARRAEARAGAAGGGTAGAPEVGTEDVRLREREGRTRPCLTRYSLTAVEGRRREAGSHCAGRLP